MGGRGCDGTAATKPEHDDGRLSMQVDQCKPNYKKKTPISTVEDWRYVSLRMSGSLHVCEAAGRLSSCKKPAGRNSQQLTWIPLWWCTYRRGAQKVQHYFTALLSGSIPSSSAWLK